MNYTSHLSARHTARFDDESTYRGVGHWGVPGWRYGIRAGSGEWAEWAGLPRPARECQNNLRHGVRAWLPVRSCCGVALPRSPQANADVLTEDLNLPTGRGNC